MSKLLGAAGARRLQKRPRCTARQLNTGRTIQMKPLRKEFDDLSVGDKTEISAVRRVDVPKTDMAIDEMSSRVELLWTRGTLLAE